MAASLPPVDPAILQERLELIGRTLVELGHLDQSQSLSEKTVLFPAGQGSGDENSLGLDSLAMAELVVHLEREHGLYLARDVEPLWIRSVDGLARSLRDAN